MSCVEASAKLLNISSGQVQTLRIKISLVSWISSSHHPTHNRRLKNSVEESGQPWAFHTLRVTDRWPPTTLTSSSTSTWWHDQWSSEIVNHATAWPSSHLWPLSHQHQTKVLDYPPLCFPLICRHLPQSDEHWRFQLEYSSGPVTQHPLHCWDSVHWSLCVSQYMQLMIAK